MAQLSQEVLDRLRKEVESDSTKTGNYGPRYGYWKPKKGTMNRVRILPGQEPGSLEKNFFVKVKQHSNVSPSTYTAVHCPRTLNPVAECPVCSRVDALYKSASEQDRVLAGKMKARDRFFFGVIPLDGEQAGQIVVWSTPKLVRNAIISYMSDSDYGDITHPQEGFDMKVTISGEGLNTVYNVIPAPHPTAITDDEEELQEILNSQPPLWKLRRAAPPEEIRKFMSGELQNLSQGFYAKEDNDSSDDEVPYEEEEQFETIPVTTVSAPVTPVVESKQPSFEEEIVRATPKAVATPATNVETPKRPKFDIASINAQVKRIGKTSH